MLEDLSVWNGLKVRPSGDVLAFIAEEIWRRTKAPFFAAERARAMLVAARAATPEERQKALAQLTAIHEAELAESRRQAALVSQALAETAPEAYEAWCRAAMEWLRLAPMGEAEADECRATAARVYDEILHPASPAPNGDAPAPARSAA